MFKPCVIHYPTDEKALKAINKELASFRIAETVKFVQSLNLNDRQTEALFNELESEVAAKQEGTA